MVYLIAGHGCYAPFDLIFKSDSIMRLRLTLWCLLLILQFLATALLPEAIAPAVAGSIYAPLFIFDAAGLPVFSGTESGGWASPSPVGWLVVVVFWAAVWWGVVSFAGYLLKRRIKHG